MRIHTERSCVYYKITAAVLFKLRICDIGISGKFLVLVAADIYDVRTHDCQSIEHGFRRATASQHHGFSALYVDAVLSEHGGKTVRVGIVTDKPAADVFDSVYRTYMPRLIADFVQKRHYRLLIGHGDVHSVVLFQLAARAGYLFP